MKKLCWLFLGAAALLVWLILSRPAPVRLPRAVRSPIAITTASQPQPPVTSHVGQIAPVSQRPQTQNPKASDPAVILISFREWTTNYLQASAAERESMKLTGADLARARRPVFRDLIKNDPRRAIKEAVPIVVRQQLPDEIVDALEERVNGKGVLRVYQGVGSDNSTPVPTHRIAEFQSGRTFDAYVYGRRSEDVRWLSGSSLNGVAIDQSLAVHEDPFRTLEVGELPDPARPAVAVCPVSGKSSLAEEDRGEPITEETPAIEAFGEIVYLCDGTHAIVYKEQLIMAEGGSGGPVSFTGILPAAPTPSLGNVKVLVIPLTFADQNDVPSSESVLYQLMRDVGDHYAKASYGKLTLLTTVTPPIKLPHNEAWYVQKDTSVPGGTIDGLGLEHSHARAEARKMGFDDEEFDCIVVRLRGGARPVGGYGGGKSVWIYGDGVDVTAHEIGHSFGLAHANFWQTAGTSAIGTGSNEEYGGHWDVMGGIGLPYGHYNVQAKNQIKWLPDPFVAEILTSGLYRIYAQDQAILDPSKRFALKIQKDSGHTYWGELRGLYTGHATRTWADYGLILGWRFPGGGGSNIQLIDTTPGTSFGKDDSPISLGRTFSDTEAGIHLTTIAVYPATTEEPKSVDVMVNLGGFPSNRPPTLALSASATVVPVNAPVTFTATASDPDGDLLAYSWQHFGDPNYRTISPNAAVITRSFSASGTYVVTCTVSDMKGGATIRNLLVTVGNGGGRFNISGRITLSGQPVAGVLVNANSANGVITDSDGRFIIPNLSAATYVLTPLLYGYTFTELFNNNVVVGPSFDGAEFEAAADARVSITATVPTASENNAAAPAQFTLTRNGDASQALTVNILGPIGTATSTADYTFAPAPAAGSQGYSTLTIPAGADTLAVSITPVNDSAAEGPETVILDIAPGNGYVVEGLARSVVVINDDDSALPKVSLAVVEAKTLEGSGVPATVSFRRTGSTVGALNVAYTVAGTASGSDFSPLSGALTIPAGAASAILPINSVDDTTSESLETVTINIASTVAFIADPVAATATVSIVDDDTQVVTVTATDAVATERDLTLPDVTADTATFLVNRTGDISQPLTVYYAVSGVNSGTTATALHGVDYEALPGTLVIPAGQANGAITIIPRWDGIGEGPESVTLQLGAGPTNYRLGVPNSASITINDAGDPPYVEVLGVDNAVEPSTPGRFRFSLKGSISGNVVVNYTLSGSATNGVDFTTLPGSITIPGNGVNTIEVAVNPVNDALAEDLKTITLTITPSPNYQVFGPSGSATIWMRDDEQPTVFVDAHSTSYPPSLAENGTAASFYLSRLGSTTASLTVNYTMSGTATNGADYQLVSGTATIAAGALGVDVPITPINDGSAEGTETITLNLAPGAYSRGPSATFYLTDDETPSITASFPSSSGSGPENSGAVNIPVNLTSSSAAPITVEYMVDSGGRATSTASGAAPASLPYWVRCDRIGNTVIGLISPDGTNWTGVSTQTVAMPSTAYLAGLHVCSFNVGSLSACTFDNVIITNLSVGATVGARTGLTVGTTAIAGSSSVNGSIYTVSGAGDNVEGTTDQGYYTYWPINNSVNCTIIARVLTQQNTSAAATAGVMIRESTVNNVRRGYMAATPGSGFEFHYRATTAVAEAKVSSILQRPSWVRLQRSGNVVSGFQSTDGTVWTPVGGAQTIAFGPELLIGLVVSGQVEGTLVTVSFDNVTLTPGPLPTLLGRTVGFTAIQGSDTLAGGVYTMTGSGDGINGTHDDFYFVSENVSGDFTFTARVVSLQSTAASPQAGIMLRENTKRIARHMFLSGPPGLSPQLSWRTSTTTAANAIGLDYTLAPGLLTFPPGSTTQNIVLNVVDDTISERDETISIFLRNANGARLGSSEFTYVIVDDDSPPSLPFAGFASPSSSAQEAAGTVLLPVALSIPAPATLTVDYVISAGTATPVVDFLEATGTLTFAPGDTVQQIPVTLVDDSIIESARSVSVTLSNVVGARLGSLTNHTLTILDDDSAIVTISSTDTNAAETGDTATLTVARSGSTVGSLTVNLLRTGGAGATIDYTGFGSTVIIPDGESSVTVTLTAVQDSVVEGTETAVITVSSGSGYVVGSPSSVSINIADDDRNTVTITADTPTAFEGGSSGSLTVTRTGNTSGALTVTLTVTGTATSGADYTTTPTPITSLAFSVGQATRTIQINPVNDSAIEDDETVLVQIAAGAYDIGGVGYASVIIKDNDIPPTVFISSPGAQGVVVATTNGVELVAEAEDDGLPQPLAYHWTQVSGPGIATFGATNTPATPARFSAPGTYLVRVTVSDGQFSASDQITVNIGPTNALTAADWFSSDIGPPTLRGFSGIFGSNWVLSATGIGFASNSDRAHAVSRQVTSNATIVARLVAVSGPAAAEGGLSVRDSLHRYARRAALVYQGSTRTLRFRPRLVSNTIDTSVSVANLNLPLWLKIDRVQTNNIVTAYYATNNAGAPGPWTQIGSPTAISMDATADYSLTGDSGSDTAAAILTFDNLLLTPAPVGPATFPEDFGDAPQAGTYSYVSGTDTHTLVGQGSLDSSGMFWGQQFTGDLILTALQTDATSGANNARTGIILRDSMDDGPMAFVGRNPQGAFGSFLWRTNPKGGIASLTGVTQKRRWLRLIRKGNQVTALHAPDNSGVAGAWVQIGQPQTVFLQPTTIVGLYCDNGGSVGVNTATFQQFSVVPLNKAPVVDAGTAPANPSSPLAISGRVRDDGLPAPFTTVWTAAAAPGPVTFGNSNLLSTTASFSGSGLFTLRLWADDGVARSFNDINFSTYTSFQNWQNSNFIGGVGSPNAAPDADPDADGLNNAGEYACGTNPNTAAPSPVIVSLVRIGPDDYLRVTVPKSITATDASIAVEASLEISPGSWSTANLLIEESTPTLLRVRSTLPISNASQHFMRVRVTLN